MSSRIRYIIQYDGGFFAGQRAKYWLEQYVAGCTKSLGEMKQAASLAPAKLWVFREPRGIRRSRSRYMKFCQMVGLLPKKKKPAKPMGLKFVLQQQPAPEQIVPEGWINEQP